MKKILCVLSVITMMQGGVHARVRTSSRIFSYVPPRARVVRLSRDPVVMRIDNFISDAEINDIKNIATPHLSHSLTGVGAASNRTSSTAFLELSMGSIVGTLQERAACMVNVPADRVEVQVVRYQQGQQYKYHYDFFTDDAVRKSGSQRIYTFFVYLNDCKPDQDGGTDFPELNLTVTPRKGSAVFWRNVDDKGNKDYRMSHAGLPVAYGEKWGVNIWIHDAKVQ